MNTDSLQETLNATAERFLRASEDGTLLCAEDLLPILSDSAFSSFDTLVLSIKRNARAIVPSLCVGRPNGKEALVLRKIDTLLSVFLNGANEYKYPSLRNYDHALEVATQNGFIERLKLGTSRVLTRGEFNLPHDVFRQLAVLSGLLRESSLNLLNDSLDIRDDEARGLRLSASLDETVASVARFARDRYSVDARVLRDDYGKGEWVELDSTLDPRVQPIIEILGSSGIPSKPTLVRNGPQYSLLFPVVRRGIRLDEDEHAADSDDRIRSDDQGQVGTKRARRFRHVLVITSTSPIRRYVVTNLLFHFQRYFDHHLQAEQQRCLASLREKAAELAAEVRYPHHPSDFKHLEIYRTYVTQALERLCQLTTALSASFRLYNPVHDSLDQIALYEDGSTTATDPSWDRLQLSQGGVNTRAFEADEPYIYVPDLSRLRIKLRLRKERQEKPARQSVDRPEFLDRRTHSQSELCVSLFYKKTKIGVINLESPLRDGLRSDIAFIVDVVKALEQLLVALLDSNDQRWLYSRDRHQQSFHELMNLVTDREFPATFRERFNRQIDILRGVNISEGDQQVALTGLIEFRDRYVETLKTLGTVADDLMGGCRIHINDQTIYVRRYWLGCVETIYRNLLDNLRAHADVSRDTVVIDQPAPRAPRHIKLQAKSSTRFDVLDPETLLIAPVAKADRLHYGLFVVGAIARHLGGYAYAGNVPDGGGIVVVTLPLDTIDTPQEAL